MADLTKLLAATPAGGDTSSASTKENFFMGGARTMGQGLTFGYGDEIEGYARAAAQGIPYSQAVGEARKSIGAYKEQNPWKSLGLEVLGSLPLALTGLGYGYGLKGMMGLGAASGAITATGVNEGDIRDRVMSPSVLAGGALGAVAAPVMAGTTKVVGRLFNGAVDYARRKLGDRGSMVFENYIKDAVSRTGKSADELVAEIGEGRMLVDNQTVASIARGALVQNAESGTSKSILDQATTGRAAGLRSDVSGRLLRDLTGEGQGDTAAAIQRRMTGEAEQYKKQAYAPFINAPLDQALTRQLLKDLQSAPSIMSEIDDAYRLSTRGRSLFVKDKNGSVVGFDRDLTADDAERVRRAAANLASREYDAGRGLVGEAAANLEGDIRSSVDTAFPDLADVRENTSSLFKAGLATKPPKDNVFELGQKAVLNADQAALAWNDVVGDPLLESAYRRGLMDSLSRRLQGTTANKTLSRITDEGDAFYQVMQMVYPDAAIDDAMRAMKVAVDAQSSRNTLFGGSPTAGNASESARINAGIDPMDAFEATSGSIPALIRVASKLFGDVDKSLSTAEKERLARILVSTDQDLVRNALIDDTALRTLQNGLKIFVDRAAGAAGIGGASSAAILVPRDPLKMTIDTPAGQ